AGAVGSYGGGGIRRREGGDALYLVELGRKSHPRLRESPRPAGLRPAASLRAPHLRPHPARSAARSEAALAWPVRPLSARAQFGRRGRAPARVPEPPDRTPRARGPPGAAWLRHPAGTQGDADARRRLAVQPGTVGGARPRAGGFRARGGLW